MPTKEPRLRGQNTAHKNKWQLGFIPDEVLFKIGEQITHRLAVGNVDIKGDDFGNIFANSIDGIHRESPLGVADVLWNGCAWSVKTIKNKKPHNLVGKTIRLISGRNSPDFSVGIKNPHVNPTETGRAVLSIWNSRLREAQEKHKDIRIIVMVRNIETKEFLLFETDANRYVASDFNWSFNKRNNLEGREKINGTHRFSWQPHGSQFTILRIVPASARCFKINRRVPNIQTQYILDKINYKQNWISILESKNNNKVD